MLKQTIAKLVQGINLSESEAIEAMNCIMEGNATDAQIGRFLTALRIKGETIDEITGAAKVMRDKAEKLELDLAYYIDTCGTGGDLLNTFNISTAVAFVTAAAGIPVAKHGNRSVSSKSGSADVLEALGIKVDVDKQKIKHSIEKLGIGFMFAPSFHKSMKYAAGARKELGIRTIFNILGPITNPAGAKGQILGIYDQKLTEPIANVLRNLQVERALVLCGQDGMDEISLCGSTKISDLHDGEIINYIIEPEEFKLKKASRQEIMGGDAKTNAEIIIKIFSGEEKGAKKDIVLLNSAAAFYVGKKVQNMQEGIELAEDIIDSGKAMKKLEALKKLTPFEEKAL